MLISIHVPHESDDPECRNIQRPRRQKMAESGAAISGEDLIGTGQAVKYSPIAQQRPSLSVSEAPSRAHFQSMPR